MSEKRYVVPEEMLRAAWNACKYTTNVAIVDPRKVMLRKGIEAGLKWLADNPIAPPHSFGEELCNGRTEGYDPSPTEFEGAVMEWQRRMFLAPDPESPEEIKDLLVSGSLNEAFFSHDIYNERILDAYRRGQKAGAK